MRLAAAFRSPRFQVVVLLWTGVLSNLVFLPDARGFAIDAHVYADAFRSFVAGQPVYLVPDPTATAMASGLPIYFFPPPTAALLAGTIGLLPGGVYAWLAFNLGCVVGAFLIVRTLVPTVDELVDVPPALRALLAGGVWLFFPPVVLALHTGNQNGVFLLALSVIAAGVVKERPALTAAGLAISVLLKPAAALFALPLLVSGRRKEVALAVAVSAAGVVLSLPFVGVTAWVDFAAAVLRHSELYQAQGYNAAPLHAFLPIVPEITWMALAAVAMAACGRAEPRRMVAGSIAGFLLLWPVLWIHYAALALVALALLAPDARRPVLALIYALFALPFHPTWLAAGVLLVLVSLRGPATSRAPDWNARAVMPKPGFQANRQT